MFFDKLIERKVTLFEQELLQKYYAEVESMYGKMRGWRHDYRHHIQAMKVHAAKGELAEIQCYLDMLDDDLTNVETVIRTGNRAADAVLNSKLSLAGERQIRIKAEVRIPVLLTTPELDLCTIIGNLLDNAMEACLKIEEQEKRFLRVYIDVLKGQLYIYVMNSVGEKPQKKGRLYLTTKDSRNHGFGLMRMDRVVAKYHGYLDRQNEEGVFATEVLLPL